MLPLYQLPVERLISPDWWDYVMFMFSPTWTVIWVTSEIQ
jgi:hypothetical protein